MPHLASKSVFVAGHRGMVGAATRRCLERHGMRIISANRSEVNLCDLTQTSKFLANSKPDIVIVAAAQVGGIWANSQFPVEFLTNNLRIALNTIEASYSAGVSRLLFLGSTCIYPREAPQPIPEDALLSGPLEPTNEAYALAKIAGLKLCEYYRRQHAVLFHSAMPTNLYGPGDNYHPEHSHVLPALIRRFYEAKLNNTPSVSIWGTGEPLREFLHVDDLADAILHLLTINDPPDWVNIGSGEEVTILQLAQMVAEVIDYRGKIICDASKPDGTPRKLADCALIRGLGWRPKISLQEGLASTYRAFVDELNAEKLRIGASSSSVCTVPSHLAGKIE